MDGNKSDDSFYDSDQDELLAAASTQSLYDPSSPYTPVTPSQHQHQRSTSSQFVHSITLSGRRLSSTVCVKATESVVSVLSQLTSPPPSSSVPPSATMTSPISSFIKASPISFIKASCYYEEAKELSRQQTATAGEPLPPLHLEKSQKASASSTSGHALEASFVRKRPISTDSIQKPSRHGQMPSSDNSSTSSVDSDISSPKHKRAPKQPQSNGDGY